MTVSRTQHHRGRRPAAALGAVLLLGACGPAPTLDDALSTVHSWTATATLAGAHERAGILSHRLAAQLHDRGDEARREGTRTLDTLARSANDRRRAQAALDSLDRALRDLGAQPTGR
jgi:hypothetical protein